MSELFYSEYEVRSYDASRYSDYKDLVLLEDLGGREVRNIAIMYIKSEYKNNVKYLLILGVDIFTQKMVRLVDTYGMKYGFCRDCEEYEDLRIKTVIKVPCKIYEGSFLNTLRIIGKPLIIGKTDFRKLLLKLEIIQNRACSFFPYSQIDVPCFLQVLHHNPDKEFYARVNISSTIKKHQGKKYQLKFSSGKINRFADIIDARFLRNHHNLDGKFIKGTALVKGILIKGNIQVYVIKIHNPSIYESKRSYDKMGIKRQVGMFFSDKYIEELLDKGYTARSREFPGTNNPEDLSFPVSYDLQGYDEWEIARMLGEDNDFDFSPSDYELDYGYMEDEDYEE